MGPALNVTRAVATDAVGESDVHAETDADRDVDTLPVELRDAKPERETDAQPELMRDEEPERELDAQPELLRDAKPERELDAQPELLRDGNPEALSVDASDAVCPLLRDEPRLEVGNAVAMVAEAHGDNESVAEGRAVALPERELETLLVLLVDGSGVSIVAVGDCDGEGVTEAHADAALERESDTLLVLLIDGSGVSIVAVADCDGERDSFKVTTVALGDRDEESVAEERADAERDLMLLLDALLLGVAVSVSTGQMQALTNSSSGSRAHRVVLHRWAI